MPVNSLMSAPAMKPLFLAEMSTRPRGRDCSSFPRCSLSSASTLAESTLAEVPGLSKLSHAMRSASSVSVQAGAAAAAGSFMGVYQAEGKSGGRGTSAAGTAQDLEVAHQRAMVGEAYVRDAEPLDLDALAHEHEVELDARDARREGGQACGIGAAQSGGAHEEVDLVRAPEGVEVPGHDHRLRRLLDEVVERAQLVLAVAVLDRQVHQEHAHLRELKLDDEALDAGIEVVEALAVHGGRRQEGVALLAHDGHELVERVGPVLGLVGGIVAELAGDVVGLVQHAGADRAGINLDEADDVGFLGADELGDAAEHLAVAAQVACARQRQVEGGSGAGGVADVVDEQSHGERFCLQVDRKVRILACAGLTVCRRPPPLAAGVAGTPQPDPSAGLQPPPLVPDFGPCRRPIRSSSS